MKYRFLLTQLFLIGLLLTVSIFPHSVLLKNGEVIKGTVTSQDQDSIAITEESGAIRSVAKKSILKVVYRDVTAEDLAKIRKEEEQKIASERKLKEDKAKEEEAKKKQLAEAERIQTEAKNKPSFTFYTTKDSNCKELSTSKEWYWLFGTYSLTKPNWDTLIPKNSKAIRIRNEASFTDTLISIFIGYAVTITRKTIYVDVCEMDGNYRILTESEFEKEKSKIKEEIEFESKLKDKLDEDDLIRLENELKSNGSKP